MSGIFFSRADEDLFSPQFRSDRAVLCDEVSAMLAPHAPVGALALASMGPQAGSSGEWPTWEDAAFSPSRAVPAPCSPSITGQRSGPGLDTIPDVPGSLGPFFPPPRAPSGRGAGEGQTGADPPQCRSCRCRHSRPRGPGGGRGNAGCVGCGPGAGSEQDPPHLRDTGTPHALSAVSLHLAHPSGSSSPQPLQGR